MTPLTIETSERALSRRAVGWTLAAAVLAAVLAILASRIVAPPEVGETSATRIDRAWVTELGATPVHAPPPVAIRQNDAAIGLPDNWDSRRSSYSGYVVYDLDISAINNKNYPIALYLPALGMNAEVWLNGARLGGLGRMEAPRSRHFYTPMLITLPVDLLRTPLASNRLQIVMVGHPGYRSGLAPVWIGDYGALYDAWRLRAFWQNDGTLITIVINMTLAAFVLMIAWRDRGSRAFAWFGLAALVWGLRNLNYVVVNPPISDLLFATLCVSGASWFVAFFSIFAAQFSATFATNYRQPRWLAPAVFSFATLSTLYFLSASTYQSANAAFAVLAAVGIGFTVWSMLRLVRLAWAVPRGDLLAVACGALIYLLLLLNDYAIGTNKTSLGEIYIRQYAALPLFFAITITLARRYVQALLTSEKLAASLQDEVERQRAQLAASFAQLRNAEHEQARSQERARVMADLHDGLGMQLVTALRQARVSGVAREAIVESLEDCMDELRIAIDALGDAERDPLALLGNLRFRMAPRLASLGIDLAWEIDDALDATELAPLDAAGALHLLRIAQEALGNAIKHANATRVTLSLTRSPTANDLQISITDNGSGIDLAQQKRRENTGHGMKQMRERAQQLGASFDVASGEAGTRVTVTLRQI